ncbi:MAG: hypothetical protein JNK72_12430 [Myxococcales bacterium]|nr:hypothetical protein [Myxococcales bacterium]
MSVESAVARVVCEACGAPVRFDPESQGLRCAHCRHVARLTPRPVTLEAHPLDVTMPDDAGEPAANLTALECQSCGAVVERTEAVIAEACPWCASTLVRAVDAQEDATTPTALLPFRVPRSALAEKVGRWAKRQWLRRGDLKTDTLCDEAVGVYAPFWIFSAELDVSWRAERARRATMKGAQGAEASGQGALVWEPASGRRAHRVEALAVCASRGVPTALADGFEAPPLGSLVAWDRRYLEGFRAERPAISQSLGWSHALKRVERSLYTALGREVGGETHRGLQLSMVARDPRWRLLLVPIWVARVTVGGRPERLLIDGLRGRVSGALPWSAPKVLAAAAAVVTLVAYLVGRGRG